MRYWMFLLALLFANMAQAIDCEKVPDCTSLGYSNQNDPNCAENGYMFCPFDNTYKVCVNYDCKKLGFTESDKTSWCADLIECKGNKKMTLCQKACVATKYEELKDLAGSGKCKLITMKNDITIPKNESLTLAANTMIDGGGHTLTSSGDQANYIVINSYNNTGFKNIKIRHTQTDNQNESRFLKASARTDIISFENMDVFISSNDNTTGWSTVFAIGTYNIRGKFALDIEVNTTMVGFFSSTCHFTDAQISLKGNQATIADTCDLTFTNSTFQQDTLSSLFIARNSVTFKNSEANLKGKLFYGTNGDLSLILEGGAEVSLDLSLIHAQGSTRTATLMLKGSTDNPAVLKMNYQTSAGAEKTNIVSSNTTDKLVLNGTTYQAKVPSTSLLSQIPSSDNWIHAQ